MLVRALFTRKLSRLPVDRLLEILSDGQPHTAGELAFQLRVSSRTVRRHLHILRDEKGLPIQLSRRGFVLAQPTPASPEINGAVKVDSGAGRTHSDQSVAA